MFQLVCTQQYILTTQLLQQSAPERACQCVCVSGWVVKCVCEMYLYCTIYLCLACTPAFTVRLQLITCLCCGVPRGGRGILLLRELQRVGQSSVSLLTLRWPRSAQHYYLPWWCSKHFLSCLSLSVVVMVLLCLCSLERNHLERSVFHTLLCCFTHIFLKMEYAEQELISFWIATLGKNTYKPSNYLVILNCTFSSCIHNLVLVTGFWTFS